MKRYALKCEGFYLAMPDALYGPQWWLAPSAKDARAFYSHKAAKDFRELYLLEGFKVVRLKETQK